MDNRKENEAQQRARVRKRTMPILHPTTTASVAHEFLLPAKRREGRQTDFISAISTKGGAKREYVHDTINIIDKVNGRSPLRSQAKL